MQQSSRSLIMIIIIIITIIYIMITTMVMTKRCRKLALLFVTTIVQGAEFHCLRDFAFTFFLEAYNRLIYLFLS